MHGRILTTLVVLTLWFAPPALGCCFGPGDFLWEQSHEAKLIVLAEVEEIRPSFLTRGLKGLTRTARSASRVGSQLDPAFEWILEDWTDLQDFNPAFLARVRVHDRLKGEAPRSLDVRFHPFDGCSPPLVPGQSVIFFLSRRMLKWETYLGSPSILPITSESFPDYQQVIEDAVRKGPSAGPEERRQWLLLANSLPATRPHALADLKWSLQQKEDPFPALTSAELQDLAEHWLASPAPDASVLNLLALLDPWPDPRIDAMVAAQVAAALEEEKVPWWADDVLCALGRRIWAAEVDCPDLSESTEIHAYWTEIQRHTPITARDVAEASNRLAARAEYLRQWRASYEEMMAKNR